MFLKVVFLIVLIGINGFFAASEIALISLNDNKIKRLAEEGHKKAKQLLALIRNPSRFLATIQVGITLAGFLASAFAAESFADPIVKILGNLNLPLSDGLLNVATVVVITIILAYFTLVLGELVPKRIAMKNFEKIAFTVVGPLTVLSKMTKPFVKFLTFSTNFFIKILGMDPDDFDQEVTEEEIRMMIDVGEEKGTIKAHEKTMINNIFEFNDKTLADVMTHRVEMIAVEESTNFINLMASIQKKNYSRIPIYKGSVDHIVGILHIKDLIKGFNEKDGPLNWSEYIRKPFYFSLNKKTDEVFVQMQQSKAHMAIIIDEYGGTAGLVTMEDLLEEIVGHIYDEYDQDADLELKKIDDNTFEASGMINLLELEVSLGMNLPTENYETLNGFITGLYGRIPTPNEKCQVVYENVVFEVLQMTEMKIQKVKIKLLTKA